jgi:hypothetical protein
VSIQPVEWVPVTVPTADADLFARRGFFLGIRAVTAFPTGVAFRLVIPVRDQNVADGVDYRAICGHSINGSPPPPNGLAVRARAEIAGVVSECRIWPGAGGGSSYSDSRDFTGTQINYSYWLPIPSGAGGVALIAAWPDQDVPETRLRLDLDAIRAAASRAVRV